MPPLPGSDTFWRFFEILDLMTFRDGMIGDQRFRSEEGRPIGG